MKHFDLVRPLILQGLFQSEMPTESNDFKKWIASGQYVVRNILPQNSLEIEANNEHAFYQMMSHDACRMAAAAFESMFNIYPAKTLPKSFSWIAIKAYYAAFFAANSTMRCFGYTCSQLEKGHINQINEFATLLTQPHSLKVQRGYYTGTFDPNSRIIHLEKMKNTHEDTWKTYSSFLSKLESSVLTVNGVSSHKQLLSSSLTDLRTKLTDDGRFSQGSYLSSFRNAVNYRQEHNSWHPYGSNAVEAKKIIDYLDSWKMDDMTSSSVWRESIESYKFFSACREVVHINYLLIKIMSESSAHRTNLFKQWPLKLLRLAYRAN